MNQNFNLKALLAVTALFVLPVAQAATMAKADYTAEKSRISASYKSAKESCKSMSANAKDVCTEEAKAREKVARAELEYGYTGKPNDQTNILVARAESTYAVEKEKCDDKAGNDKDVCVKQAKANETKALADAKLGKQVSEAKTEAKDDKRDAEYKVAAEKCDALAGDAKSGCMTAAKTKFGKN